jgi:saccharopine dehydrogenase-like NADP-dependent oxidoreductase
MNKARPSVLVVGGSGVFGSHLCRRLARLGLFQIQIAGRNRDHAMALIAELNGIDPGCEPRFLFIDRSKVLMDEFKLLGIAAVVDAAGPFQDSSYRVAEAAIEAGVHYIDLADARAFVSGLGRLNQAAQAADVAILSGASSSPAISSAILRDLTIGWKSIDRIWVSIVPGSWSGTRWFAPHPTLPGKSVVEAILSWAGEPVRVFDDGRWQMRTGWSGVRKVRLAQLGWRRTSLAETPDLDVLVDDFHPRISARFHAGLELGIMHAGLRVLAALRSWRFLPRLTFLSGTLHTAAKIFSPVGTDTGGMTVEVEGLDQEGNAVRAEAQLIATDGHGPIIPSLAAVALLKRIAEGTLTFRGAAHGGGHVKTSEIMALVPDLSISFTTDIRPRGKPLFREVLGASFEELPKVTQALHRGTPAVIGEGKADIEAQDNFMGRVISALFRFPKPGKDVPVSVVVEQIPGAERWLRRYPGRDMISFMANADPQAQTLEERFGPFRFRMKITAHADGLDMEMVSARCGRLPLPKFLTPRITANERTGPSNRHQFEVSISLPLIGNIVSYTGWLALK